MRVLLSRALRTGAARVTQHSTSTRSIFSRPANSFKKSVSSGKSSMMKKPVVFSAPKTFTSLSNRGSKFSVMQFMKTVKQPFAVSSNTVRQFSSKATESAKAVAAKNPLQKAWITYNAWLSDMPLLTKAVTSAIIVSTGDIFCQLFITDEPFSYRRAANFFFLGGAIIAPVLHNWFPILYRLSPGDKLINVAGRVGLDQTLFAPLFIPGFFGCVFALEGRLGDLPGHLEKTYWPTLKTNWMLWIPAQFITFQFIPLHLQVLWVNGIALVWNTYLSWASFQNFDDKEEKQEE